VSTDLAPRSSVLLQFTSHLVTNAYISGTRTILSPGHRSQKEDKTSGILLKGEKTKSGLMTFEYLLAKGINTVYSRFSHIFDGVRLNTETAAFQLCDIHDEMLKQLIESANEEDLRDECDVCRSLLSCLILRFTFLLIQGH
jgi:hypothetical protein